MFLVFLHISILQKKVLYQNLNPFQNVIILNERNFKSNKKFLMNILRYGLGPHKQVGNNKITVSYLVVFHETKINLWHNPEISFHWCGITQRPSYRMAYLKEKSCVLEQTIYTSRPPVLVKVPSYSPKVPVSRPDSLYFIFSYASTQHM